MKNNFLIILSIIVFAPIGYFLYSELSKDGSKDQKQENEAHDYHLHAGFKIYKDGQLIDFSSSKYMFFSNCGVNEDDMSTVQERVHLHNNVGDVAHVHAKGVTWRNLFQSLRFNLSEEQIPVMYLNDVNSPDLLDKEISNLDSAVFIIGTSDDVDTLRNRAVELEYIEEIAKSSENCGVG